MTQVFLMLQRETLAIGRQLNSRGVPVIESHVDTGHGSLLFSLPGAQLFRGKSDWFPFDVPAEGSLAIVIKVDSERTGAGRLWHLLLSNGLLGWYDGGGYFCPVGSVVASET